MLRRRLEDLPPVAGEVGSDGVAERGMRSNPVLFGLIHFDGDVERGSVMAGQSVGMVTKEEPVAAIIAQLLAESEAALNARAADCLTAEGPNR